MCDRALSRTFAEQTNVQAPGFGERGSRHKRHPWRYGGGARPMRRPVSGVGRFHEVCWAAYVETSRSCHTASWLWRTERE
ncbi:hypothetical protein [Desulfosporosinus acidiphilus]|uniref:hypothetical protein n=1 Tax=Desulfosporosinus acidiphilus TaxID=885581 RepID=UPI0011D29B85|nr:hypothetical protein [Desulfosporosinus acidiphilus]